MNEDNEKPDSWWNPWEFDPFDALKQLGKNQEDLYNRQMINNMLTRNLQDQITVQSQRIAHLESQIKAHEGYVAEMAKITTMLIDEIKKNNV